MIRRHSTRLSQAHDEEPEDEQEQHRTAAHWYPELGSVLTDHPDPGGTITVIGMRRQGDAYGTPGDARNGEYNGGEGDLGMKWAEPGQQAWMEEHVGPQEEAPPPMYDPDMSPVMARLAAMEEAAALIGARHHATTINGTQVDDAGDAPEHGTVPRAGDPDSYDARSQEGTGDDKWNQPLPWGSKTDENAATVGMYPEGISSGSGPGISVGPFTAALDEMRRHVGTEHGFPVQDSYGEAALAAIHEGLHMGGRAGHEHGEDYETSPGWESRDGGGYHEFTGMRRDARVPWTGKERGRLHRWQEEPTATWGDFVPSSEFPLLGPGEHVSHEDDGNGIGEVEGAWRQVPLGKFRAAFNVHVRIDGKELHGHDGDQDDAPAPQHEHDDPDNDLDDPRDSVPGKNGPEIKSPQFSPGNPQDSQADKVPVNPDDPGLSPDDPGHPDNWPQAGADVSERSRAYTQGTGDGKVNRGSAPVPFSPADGDSGGGGDQGDDEDDGDQPDDEATPFSKDGALAMFTAAAGDPSFRFQFTAAWRDVVAKAKRIRAEGHVRIVHASAGMVIGEVRGDHDTYESGIQRPVGKRQSIAHWACGCPWASFHQKTASSRYAGRPCSHVMALQFEAQSRGMFGRSLNSDSGVPDWSPSSVVVKSYPPYEGEPHRGRWREEWRAPVARRSSMARTANGTAQECLYRHSGPCPAVQGRRTAGAVNHGRPAGFRSEVSENPDFDPHADGNNFEWSTHVMHGYIGPQHVGSVHYSVSDDGKGFGIGRLHSTRPGEGVASSMMDDLYGHVKRAGGWLNHGQRTSDGNAWWNSYREPHPEVNVHRAPPEAGWGRYFSPGEAAEDAFRNAKYSAVKHPQGGGYHPGQDWYDQVSAHPETNWHEQWTHALGTDAPERSATAALLRAGEDPGAVGALRLLAGLRAVADQANAPWGSQNVSQHPPQKPYGATSPPNKDQDPGSYGPLAAPDPENWGGIQEDSAYQMPIGNTAAHQVLVPGAPHPAPGDLHWPDMNGWQAEDQGTFGYTDRASAAGPSTAMDPRDPNGIRMEEARRAAAAGTPFPYHGTVPQLDGALAELHDAPEPALPSTTGDDEIEATAAADGTIGGGDAGTGQGQGAALDEAALGEFGASVRASFRQMFGGTPMGDLGRETSPQGQQPSPAGQEPGTGSMDDVLSPGDPSIQTIGNQQWSGGGADSDEVAVPAGQPQGSVDEIVASFQRSAASKTYSGGLAPGRADGDIAVAARQYLAKTADVLPKAEADELVREGAGGRARNLDLLRLEGTHYEDQDDELAKRGISLDDYDDDVMFA